MQVYASHSRWGNTPNTLWKKTIQDLFYNTLTQVMIYPLYRRRSPEQGGFSAQFQIRDQSIRVDNKWVVLHNSLFSGTFDAHINVELCSNIKSIKYVWKYINKGSDMATYRLLPQIDGSVNLYEVELDEVS